MSDSLQRVRDRVQSILTDNFNVGLDRDGDFTVSYESAQAWIKVWGPPSGDRVLVNLTVPLLFEVRATPELFKHVALHADDYIFGHLSCHETPEGITVFFTHTLLGDYLDEAELVQSVYGLVGAGNDLDDQLQGMFGGRRLVDR